MTILNDRITQAGIALAYAELHPASTISILDDNGPNWSSSTALAGLREALRGLLDAIENPSPTDGAPLIMAVADALEDRDAPEAARLVRDTDPDDDIWNNYLGPMLDEIERDYSSCTAHGKHISGTEDHSPEHCPVT